MHLAGFCGVESLTECGRDIHASSRCSRVRAPGIKLTVAGIFVNRHLGQVAIRAVLVGTVSGLTVTDAVPVERVTAQEIENLTS